VERENGVSGAKPGGKTHLKLRAETIGKKLTVGGRPRAGRPEKKNGLSKGTPRPGKKKWGGNKRTPPKVGLPQGEKGGVGVKNREVTVQAGGGKKDEIRGQGKWSKGETKGGRTV